MTTVQIKITTIASLDWPSSPLPTGRVQCGTESYLAYEARSESRISFLHFSKFAHGNDDSGSESNDLSSIQDIVKSKGDEKKRAVLDLKKLTQKQLDKLSFYDVLGGIKMHSTPEQIKRAFHKACLKYHPDKEDSAKNASGGDDPIFLKVKEAFETLSDAAKRKAYDSTVDFDDSVPSSSDIRKDNDFYKIFGRCFEKNLRFAAENDPDQAAAAVARRNLHKQQKKGKGKRGGGGKQGNIKSNGNSNGNGNGKKAYAPPPLGDDKTSIDTVNEFYDYWVKFQSWRDFTLKATKLTEHDTEMADSRYEKRWMEKEIARTAKRLKKEEMARITQLVERSMTLDPRLKRERIRIEEEKKEKVRLRVENAKKEETEQKEREEREAKEKAQNEKEEKKQKAEMKLKRDQEKKILRKAKQALRRLVIAEYETEMNHYENGKTDNPTWTSIEDMNDDVEMLCSKLSRVDLDAVAKEVSSYESDSSHPQSKLSVVQNRANGMRDDTEMEKKAKARKRELLRLEAKRKEEEARKARASKPWTKEELSALAKAVKKYPAGGANRWETISLFVNNLCRLEDPRSKEQCIEKYNQIANSKPEKDSNKKATSDPLNEWSEEQDKLLQAALSKYPASLDKNERWSSISKMVTGKTKKECVTRFKAIRLALKNNK